MRVFASPEIVQFVPSLLATLLLLIWGRPWTLLTAAILHSLFPLLVLFIFGAYQVLYAPETATDFGLLLNIVAALVIALTFGIRGFVQTRRGEPQATLRDGWASRTGVAAAILIALPLAAAVQAAYVPAGLGSAGRDVTPAATVDVALRDFKFDPMDIPVAVGTLTELRLANEDAAFHTFTYVRDGAEYGVDVPAGETATFLLKIDTAGSIRYWCKPHSSGTDARGDEMFGALVVA